MLFLNFVRGLVNKKLTWCQSRNQMEIWRSTRKVFGRYMVPRSAALTL